jgi:ankyrin repeat protein
LNNKADPNICWEGQSPLFIASSCGHTEIVKLLLNNKAGPNICCVGESPLYIASRHGRTEIVKLLLNNTANPNTCCVGESPLYDIPAKHILGSALLFNNSSTISV